MRPHALKKYLSRLFEPTRIFIGLLLAVLLWLLPILAQPPLDNTEKIRKPIQTYGGIALVSAIQANAPNCARECQIEVCVNWKPGPSPVCPRPGPGGGCCLEYQTECDPGCTDPTPTLPPTISAGLNCSNPGNDNWCIGTLSLNLNASDPQGAGLLITGTLNGNNFACPSGATSCSIPVTQETATGAVTYRVDASTGLAAAGSASYKLDATTPTLNGSLSGVAGTNSWYRSDVSLNVTSSDSLSGLAATTASINGGASSAVTGPLSFSDGISSVVITATDNAGNTTQTTQTIQVDTITPSLSTALSGMSGSNGWYVSTVTITPSASDAGSGLVSLEVSTDGNSYTTYTAPITFTDGIHTCQFRATDTAGNVTQTIQQTVKVDTTTPSIALNISGTNGKSGWYVSTVTVTPILSDSTAGIATVEAAVDSGTWSIVNGPLSFTDGLHTYQFRITDNAGNSTTIPIQSLMIDTIAPFIDMTAELSLGETVYYVLEDYGSGLELYRAVIEDDAEQYQKIVWLDLLGGNKLLDQIRWDGKFKDGTPAGLGEYFITLKISDAAGNESMKSAVVSVNFLSFLQDIPAFTVPESTTQADTETQTESSPLTQFGGENSSNPANHETITINEGGMGMLWQEGTMGETEFSVPSSTTTNSMPLDPNILWGVAATALAGATVAEWERQREEERKRHESEEAKQQKRENTEKRRSQKAHEKAVRERWAQEKAAKIEQAKQAAYNQHVAVLDYVEAARLAAIKESIQREKEEKKNEKEKAAYEQRMGEHGYVPVNVGGPKVLAVPVQQEEPKWWEKPLAWVDDHQPVAAILTGLGVGLIAVVATIAIIGTAAITLPVIAAVAGATVLTSAILAGTGTIALNNYFDRPPMTNLVQNTLLAAGTGFLISGGALALVMGCATPVGMPFCAAVPPVIDAIEQAALQIQYAYQTATGNPQAGETYIELQFEQNDNGAPGNTAFVELADLFATHGDEAVGLVNKYGDDASRFLNNVADIDLAQVTLDQGYQTSKLAEEFGIPISIIGRHADTPAEVDLRTQAVERMKELRAQGIAADMAQIQAGNEFGIFPYQVKNSTGNQEVDVFIPRDIWDNLTKDDQEKIREKLTEIYDVSQGVDFRQLLTPIDGWPDPTTTNSPGAIIFDSNGSIIHEPFSE